MISPGSALSQIHASGAIVKAEALARSGTDAALAMAAATEAEAEPASSNAEQDRLVIVLDAPSQRFVQLLIDHSDTTQRQYPSEAQLAFSRGIAAYIQAQRRIQPT